MRRFTTFGSVLVTLSLLVLIACVGSAGAQGGGAAAPTHWRLTTLAGQWNGAGYGEGAGNQAQFNMLEGSFVRPNGDVLLADSNNNRIRRLSQGQVTTFAGTGEAAVCSLPFGVGQDAAGNVYISENGADCVDVVPALGGTPTVIAGLRGSCHDVSNCRGDNARFGTPAGLAVRGNLVYVCDRVASKVKLLAYNGADNVANPANWFVTDLTHGAGFNVPSGVAVGPAGNVYVADEGTMKIYVLPKGSATWTVIAGSGQNAETDGTGLGTAFSRPVSLAVDQSGTVYVADYEMSLRRLVHLGGALTDPATWAVDTLVPHGFPPADGSSGTGKVFNLTSVTCAPDGTLYLTEWDDLRRLQWTRN
jgi:hypothetical protein